MTRTSKQLCSSLLLVVALALAGCTNPPKTGSATLYDSQLALNTAMQGADNALDAACTVPASDKCGKMLAAHQTVIDLRKTALAEFQKGRTSGTDQGAMQAAQIINGIIQQINAAVQAAAQALPPKPQTELEGGEAWQLS